MKKFAIILVALLICTPVFASPLTQAGSSLDHNTIGAKADAPNLIRFTKNLTLGVEGGKEVVKNLLYPDDYGYYESDKGYFGYIKITYTGSLLDLSK